MTIEKSWEDRVLEARAIEHAGSMRPSDLLHVELASRAQNAHGRAVRRAEDLARTAAGLAARLNAEGIGAITSGSNFLGEAQNLRDALVALETAREAFGLAIRAAEKATKQGEEQ
jgi:hypothetical protein